MPFNIPTFEVGDSFVIKNNIGEHLHIIVAEESSDKSATILLIYLSSKEIPSKDPTTIINNGEHSYITKSSWVRHQNVIICPRDNIPGKIIDHYGKVTPELLKRIRAGVEKSDRVNDFDKALLRLWEMNKLFKEIE